MSRAFAGGLLLLSALLALWPVPAEGYAFSRLLVYDVRGRDQEETALVLEQRGEEVTVWFKNYLGRRTGPVPLAEYQSCFETLRTIREFALKPEYRGKPLRATAAHGLITLAWQDEKGKQIQSIRYYAPEHTLDDFRAAFNRIWALSRYAILSIGSLESPRSEYVEEGVYFLSGSGWMTVAEIQDVVEFYRTSGQGERMARAVWRSLDLSYASAGAFARRNFLEYCVEKSMLRLGDSARNFLAGREQSPRTRKGRLAEKIQSALKADPPPANNP
ncbi:MAG: hypothetical protein AB1439_03085 [candidate division FCPU426 bacterium]